MSDNERWECGARQRHIGAEIQDCDWPACGCDPYASKVLDAVAESGFRIVKDTEMQAAIAAWLECPKDRRPSADALGKRVAEIAAKEPV